MAFNRFAKRRVKTPYGKVVVEKKGKKGKKSKPAFIPKYKMAFCLMTIPVGPMPSDNDQLEFVKASIKAKSLFTNTYFSGVPVIARTIVFRIEKWIESGDLLVVRTAKSIKSPEFGVIYFPVSKAKSWKLN